MKDCHAEADTITVAVTVELHLGIFGTPQVTSEARAGPIEGADWPGDG